MGDREAVVAVIAMVTPTWVTMLGMQGQYLFV